MRSIAAVCALFLLAACSAASVTAAPAARCALTPNDSGGPDRSAGPLRAKIGTGHVLTGIVLSPTCVPIVGARVSFWQSNANGVYTAAGRGAVLTNRSGRFRFEGPMPKPYAGRAAHIHIKVEAPGFEPLLTEYQPRGTRRGSVRLVLRPSGV